MSQVVEAKRIDVEIKASEIEHPLWMDARPVLVERYWSGETAPIARHAEARLLWSDEALYVRFACPQREPLVTSTEPQTAEKTIGLWHRDVCEIFLAPDGCVPERYFEFEVAPTGEWLDLAIEWRAGDRITDWEFNSGMTCAADVSRDDIKIVMRIPWTSLGNAPQAGARWRGNLFRCVGEGETRGYLAWRPTGTPEPCFHLPAAFGEIAFEE
ncbi:MAG TPA: carbohydrate-binding family 9-like protein [Pyrinomonadaceae bacterium]